MPRLELRTEWEEAPGVALPAYAATWARIEIQANSKAVTQFLSLPARTVRPAVYGSAFPLARWIARRWWSLLDEDIPEPLVLRGGRRTTRAQRAWLERHNLIFSREGMAFPDLSIYRADNLVGLRWVPDQEDATTPGRFVSQGIAQFERAQVAEVLADFVERVLERIDGLEGDEVQELREDWAAVRTSERDENERALCSRLAALGLDPYDADPDESLEEKLSEETLPASLLHDLLASSDPAGLKDELISVKALIERLPEPRFKAPTTAVQQVEPRPYRAGYARAEVLRKRLGLSADEPIRDLDSIFEKALGPVVSHRMDAIEPKRVEAVAQPDGYVVAGQRPSRADRFLLGRVLHHCVFVTGRDSPRRLLTQGNDWQQAASRAFAAELLAPAEALRERLGNTGWDAQEELANEFDVGPMVIAHQMQNHHLRW